MGIFDQKKVTNNDLTGNTGDNFMEAGAINNNAGKWQGSDGYKALKLGGYLDDWLSDGKHGGSEEYKRLKDWDRQAGIMKIVPKQRVQKMSYSTQAYLLEGQPYPQIQRVPISNLKVTPHQVSFDFFDTTEGKIGVSNATEKHYIMEFDIYVFDLVYFMWNHARSKNQGQFYGFDDTGGMGMYTGLRFMNQREQALEQLQEYVASNGKIKGDMIDGAYNSDGEGFLNWLNTQTDIFNMGHWKVNDWEQTLTFLNFRNNFMQIYTGWSCMFISQSFGTVEGVFTEISYEVEDGFSDAKWHCKVEESIFTDNYSTDGKKPSTSDGDGNNSGDVQV